MRAENSKTRKVSPRTRQRLNFDAAAAAVTVGSFQAELNGVERAQRYRGSSREAGWMLLSVGGIRWWAICSKALARAWSVAHAKYKISATKRMHVAETISLGEKRFVAIVAVEGREFLIGGGVGGISLLAQLGSVTGIARVAGPEFGNAGGAE